MELMEFVCIYEMGGVVFQHIQKTIDWFVMQHICVIAVAQIWRELDNSC